MQNLRGAIAYFLICCGLSVAVAGAQESKSVPLNSDSPSFSLSTGSSFSATGKSNSAPLARAAPIKAITSDVREAMDIIDRNHIAGVQRNSERVFAIAINQMLRELDPHSAYHTRSEFRELTNDNLGQYFGAGITVADFKRDGKNGTYIISVKKGTPAYIAGLRFGDKITKIDQLNIQERNSDEVRDRIRGPEGSSVTIEIERADGTRKSISVRRDRVLQLTVPSSFLMKEGVGYIALTEGFSYTTATEFASALGRLKRSGMQALVLDIRGNGGGLMTQAINIAETFLPAGRVIVSERGRTRAVDREWRSRNPHPETMPLTVLVDENTASASEIFTAAMQDNDRAVIVGARTFGKGLVQDIIPLSDGSGLTLTSERYYSPSGRSIQRDYSDGHLYDYFRHVSTGALIDKPSFAARTRNGRVVYGGDGIQPDIQIAAKAWTEKDSLDYEKAFFFARENVPTESTGIERNVERHVRWFRAMALGDNETAAKTMLENDPQFQAAITSVAPAIQPKNK